MNIFRRIWSKIVPVANKVKTFIARLWDKAQPFLGEVLSASAQIILQESKDVLIAAVKYVEANGFPTEDEKKTAFKKYLIEVGKVNLDDIKTREINLLREIAVGIWEAAKKE